VTQGRVYLFTLAECCRHRDDERVDDILRTAMGHAVDQVTGTPDQRCLVCGKPIEGAPSYLSLMLSESRWWVLPRYGGLCIDCGLVHEREWLQRFVEHNAHLAFGQIMGHA